jgi:asparagine synthase (glutamine-hydrolysing)
VEAWEGILKELNGCFALVTQRDQELLAAVDRLRTIPLFFSADAHSAYLSDDAYWIQGRSASSAIDRLACCEFRLTGYVTGGSTLDRSVSQLRAGHRMRVVPGPPPIVEGTRYYTFRHADFLDENDESLIEHLRGVHERVFRRLIENSQGRRLVIPLSGGYDSRLIGVSLRDAGARDVLCYSYGVPGNWESQISQELAEYLGFQWIYVPYTAERWRAWAATREFATYFHEAGNLASVPHIQDWPAVWKLRSEHGVASDCIFVPGHTGDFLVGGHIPKDYVRHNTLSRRAIIESILAAHYSLWDWPTENQDELRNRFAERIELLLGPISDCSTETAASLFEQWECEERQAKFICNSVRVYEHFGYEWRLPLFDAEHMDFWSRVRMAQRVGRRLYFEFVARHQNLPVTRANTDYGLVMRGAIRAIDALRLRPMAKGARRRFKRARWRVEYEQGPLAWYPVVARDEFRRRYTGREIGHAFFALKYLASIGCDA